VNEEGETMVKKIVETTKAPAAIGPYSQAVIGDNALYISGQLPIDSGSGLMPEDTCDQVVQAMKNVIAVVEAAGGTAENLVKCGLFIRDMSSFSQINEAYQQFFQKEPPARFVVEVSQLPKGADVEIDAIAVL